PPPTRPSENPTSIPDDSPKRLCVAVIIRMKDPRTRQDAIEDISVNRHAGRTNRHCRSAASRAQQTLNTRTGSEVTRVLRLMAMPGGFGLCKGRGGQRDAQEPRLNEPHAGHGASLCHHVILEADQGNRVAA